jgi:hypothetical protein
MFSSKKNFLPVVVMHFDEKMLYMIHMKRHRNCILIKIRINYIKKMAKYSFYQTHDHRKQHILKQVLDV